MTHQGGAECQCNSRQRSAGEPLTAPFRVIADFREAIDGWQFTNVPDRRHPVAILDGAGRISVFGNGRLHRPRGCRYSSSDIMPTNSWPCCGIGRIASLKQRAELLELQAAGASCLIVIEGDAQTIAQVLRESDLVASWDPSSLHSTGCDIPWLLAESQRTAEQMVFEIMHRAWQQRARSDSNPFE